MLETQEQIGMSIGLPPKPQLSPELPAEQAQPLAQGTSEQPSVTSGATGLAWWHAMKYEWRRSGAGNQYLAPQQVYVDDVLHRTNHYMNMFTNELSEDDFADFDELAEAVKGVIQLHDAHDTAGVEGNALRRHYLTRLIIASKICGVSAVSSEHRVINEMSRPNGDVEKMKGDPEGYYQSDISKRNQWGMKAVGYLRIVRDLADGDVIPTSNVELGDLITKRIISGRGVGLGDEAYEVGRNLLRPSPVTAGPNQPVMTTEDLLAMTA